MNLSGPQATQSQAATVNEVSGTVKDSVTGQAVKSATVMVLDGAGKEHRTGSDNSGKFKITGSASQPIVPGTLTIGASKDGYTTVPTKVETRAGQSVLNIALKVTPSASTSASAEAEVPPDASAGDASAENSQAGAANGGADPGTKTSSGLSMVSWILILLGIALVAFPVVVIITLWRKRDKDDGTEPELDPTAPSGPRPATPNARGMYHDAGGRGADQTMVARGNPMEPAMAHQVGGTPNMADAATAIVQPIPPASDPYAGYGDDQDYGGRTTVQPYGGAGGYGSEPTGGRSGGGYGGGAGYGAEPRGSQTGGYGTGAGAGYDSGSGYDSGAGYGDPHHGDPHHGGGHSQGSGGYGSGYGSGYGGDPGSDRGGYGDPRGQENGRSGAGYGSGYDAGGYESGGYGSGGGAGYADPRGQESRHGGGYGSGGADPRGGAGYGGDRGGYDQPRGGRHDDGYDAASYYEGPTGRQQNPPPRGGQRSVEWLDD